MGRRGVGMAATLPAAAAAVNLFMLIFFRLTPRICAVTVPRMDDDIILSLREAAKRLGVHRRTVKDMVRTRQLPSVPCPGSMAATPQRRIRKSDLDRYIAELPTTDGRAS